MSKDPRKTFFLVMDFMQGIAKDVRSRKVNVKEVHASFSCPPEEGVPVGRPGEGWKTFHPGPNRHFQITLKGTTVDDRSR